MVGTAKLALQKCLVLPFCPANWIPCAASVGQEGTTNRVLSTRFFRGNVSSDSRRRQVTVLQGFHKEQDVVSSEVEDLGHDQKCPVCHTSVFNPAHFLLWI